MKTNNKYKYLRTNTSGRPSSFGDPSDVLRQDNVAAPFGEPATEYGAPAGVGDVDVYEIYGASETPDDYPDGDPYADRILVAPDGYVWALDGSLEKQK